MVDPTVANLHERLNQSRGTKGLVWFGTRRDIHGRYAVSIRDGAVGFEEQH